MKNLIKQIKELYRIDRTYFACSRTYQKSRLDILNERINQIVLTAGLIGFILVLTRLIF